MPGDLAAPMTQCARESGCRHPVSFHQQTDLSHVPAPMKSQGAVFHYVNHGVCNGLVFSWLKRETMRSPTSLFDELKLDVSDEPTPSPSYRLLKEICSFHKNFQIVDVHERYVNSQKVLNLEPRTQKNKIDGTTSVEIKQRTFNVSEKSEVEALASWLGKSMAKRYFVVHTARHAMAATGSKFGDLKFFDPNGGVVEADSARKMSDFLFKYFEWKRQYFGDIREVDVYKFAALSDASRAASSDGGAQGV